MKIASGFVRRSVGDCYMVVPVGVRTQVVNGVIALSGSGDFLWGKLETGATEEELVAALCDEYEVDVARAAEDVRAFISDLRQAGVLEE